MKNLIIYCLIGLFLFVSECELVAQGSPVKIMPIGDSITQLNGDYNSYRRSLWHSLHDAGYNVDFVGSLDRNYPDVLPPNPDFDLDHEGHWGQRADEILANIYSWALTYQPDIALIHLGTNDIIQDQSISSTLSEIGQIIDDLRDANATIHIYLAQLIPTTRYGKENDIIDFNAQIPGLADSKNSSQSPVVVVDQWSGFYVYDDTFDDVHPNESGEEKMAAKWFSALLNDPSLPVSFSSFEALLVNHGVLLQWRTESEFQNLGFEIYRSSNQFNNFKLLDSYHTNRDLVGSYHSVSQKRYSYLDRFVQPGLQYYYKVTDVDINGIKTEHGPFYVMVAEPTTPESIILYPNFPNPFNPSTTITCFVPDNKSFQWQASLVILNGLGKRIRTLFHGMIQPGNHVFTWDGRDNNGIDLPSGNYYATLRMNEHVRTIKMNLVR